MSAIVDRFSVAVSLMEDVEFDDDDVHVEYWGKVKNSAKGCALLLSMVAVDCWIDLFWASNDWSCCSSSFTKFIAPPTMDA